MNRGREKLPDGATERPRRRCTTQGITARRSVSSAPQIDDDLLAGKRVAYRNHPRGSKNIDAIGEWAALQPGVDHSTHFDGNDAENEQNGCKHTHRREEREPRAAAVEK